MQKLVSSIGRAFARTFAASLFAYAVGVLAVPDVSTARSLALAGLLGSVAAGLRAVQEYVPELSLSHWIGAPYGDWLDAFLHGSVGSLLITLPNLLDLASKHGFGGTRQIAIAAVVGALNAGVRAVQGFLTKGEHPAPVVGVPEPRKP